MDLEATPRIHALELIVTQIIAEQFRAVPDACERARDARDRLSAQVEQLQFNGLMLDEEARLRPRVREYVNDILDAALRRTVVVPIRS